MPAALLEEIGLTKSEVAVYYALLELGSTTTGPIISKAKIAPSKVYDVLDRLMNKGLVSYIIKRNRKHFEAAPVQRILDYIDEKETHIKKQRAQAAQLLPSLELLQQESPAQNDATVYTGIKGIKTAFLKAQHEAKKGDRYLGLFIPRVDDKLVPFFDQFTQEFCKKIGKTQMLFNEPSPEKDRISKINGCTTKLLSEQFRVPTEICIIGDNVLISNTAGEFLMVMIKNRQMATSFTTHFELLWKLN
ncbi:MAG: helix-turn-helix domain-containing protein [Candidatus Woesearchaeota archaeon]|nr:helix-turn-helix domain-containing protein [Candidatus Woesearchaeota archaeon]